MSEKLVVEDIEPSDKEEVLELSSGIWEGHDYVPDVFDRWVEDGGFICGKLNGKIIALAKHTRQKNGVLWLEGLRVHPEFQGGGFAREMVEKQLDLIEDLDHTKVRFLTSGNKEPVKKLAAGKGFSIKQEYHYLRMDEEDLEKAEMPSVSKDIKKESNVEKVKKNVLSSEELEENAGQYMQHWTTYDLDEDLIEKEVKKDKCYSTGDGLAFFHHYEPYDSLSIPFINGSIEDMKDLFNLGLKWSIERDHDRYSIKTASERVVKAAEEVGMGYGDFKTVLLYER
ncbi:MAG: GNAT family N-acetyltransferase [Candidatus Thermoplasmatota archaeon]|nr:GNAT family N-acetyltransferase [Candidatus Thermoplasmatota archaeon]